jgi:D-3-phosphoglycerate dehydrogenase / 2-oxoglutarate reductase
MKIVILDSLFGSLELERETAAARGATTELWDGRPSSLADAEIVVHVRTRIDSALIAAMPRCRVIARFGTGLDTVDVAAAEAAGIEVVTVRDYCIPELPSHSLALAFALTRRLAETAGNFDETWTDVASSAPLARYVSATVIGLGSVGTRVAAALAALGYTVYAVTEHNVEAARSVGAEVVPLEQGLAAAEILFLHSALDETTRNLVDRRRLELMREGALLINTARLGLIDEAAVAAALDERRLGGLGLDAKLDPASPLRRFADDPRVLVTPHLGWYSEGSAATLRAGAINRALDVASNRDKLEVNSTGR